jgi:GT2 family glycosyltransferase
VAESSGAGAAGGVGALLLNWRQPALTEQCLIDLLATGQPRLRVLLMDNASADGSAARLRAVQAAAVAKGAAVELAEFEHNLGFAGAMNRGLAWAAGHRLDFVLVLNNDLRLPPDFLAPLVEALQNDPRLAAVGPTVLRPDGRVWAQGGRVGFHANTLRLLGHGRQPAPRQQGPEAVDFLPGACVLLRATDVAAVGGFDERYFMYMEDVDICHRLRARGRGIVWLPWVRVTHAAGASSGGSRSPLRKFLMAMNSVRFLRRHGSFAQWAAFVLLDLPTLLPLLLLAPRTGWAKACGIAAGIRGRPASAADVARWR